MQMFIANGMHQNIDFQYRLPGVKNVRTQLIPIGQQIRISGELNEEQLNAIIKGHTHYGMMAAKDISSFKKFFIPYVYSINTPISAETILELVLQNDEYNVQVGRRLREEAAVAVSDVIEKNTTDHLKSLEMTIEEVPSRDPNREYDSSFAEGIRVTRDREKGAPQGPDRGLLDFSLNRRVIKPQF